jgi:hypothetical protein
VSSLLTVSVFQQTHIDQNRSKFLLNNVQPIFLNVNSYLSRHDKCHYEFPSNRIPNMFMNPFSGGHPVVFKYNIKMK